MPSGPDPLTGLNLRQARFLAALLEEPSIAEASLKVGIDRKTGWRWYHLPRIADAYARARKEVVEQALSRLQLDSASAAKRLKALCDHENPYVAVNATRSLIDLAVKAAGFVDLEQRLRALEEASDAAGQRGVA